MESIPENEAIVEGIGDEVLVTFVFGGIAFVLMLAWYSTNLTHSQTRLTADSVRIHRRNIVLNRRIGSSTADLPAAATQETSDLRSPEQSSDNGQTSAADTVDSDGVDSVGPTAGDSMEADGQQQSALSESPNNPPDGVSSPPTEQPSDDESSQPVEQSDTESYAGNIVAEVTADLANDQAPSANDQAPNASPPKPKKDDSLPDGDKESDNHPLESTEQLSNPTVSSVAAEAESAQTDDANTILIRIKFLNDDERIVRAKLSDTIAHFKRCNFAAEMADNKLVRIIFNGQVLQDDRTLQACNISENSAVHVLISDNAAPNHTQHVQTEVMFNAGVLMVPLFTVILGILWYLRLQYPDLFNVTSTMSLSGITSVFIFCLVAQLRPRIPQNADRDRHYGVNIGTGNTLGDNR